MDLKKNWYNKFMMNYSFNGLLFPPHKIKIKLFKEDIRRFIGIFNLILYLFVFNKNLDPAESQDNGLFLFFIFTSRRLLHNVRQGHSTVAGDGRN